MTLNQKQRVEEFIDRWRGRGDEKQETQLFWLDLMQNVLGLQHAIESTKFEYKTASNGFIDVLCPDARFLVEQKSSDVDLDKPEPRQGTMVTPIQQAVRYSDNLPLNLNPSKICVCNFQRFRLYDLESDPCTKGEPVDDFALEDLYSHFGSLMEETLSHDQRCQGGMKKAEEHVKPDLVAQPVVKLATAENFSLTEVKEERLSRIIAEINSRTGKSYDNDVAVKAMLQIRDIMLKSDKLKTSAKNNSEKDFEFSYFDNIDDALIEGLDQNQDFFTLLLGNEEIKREVLGIFAEEIYRSLRDA